MILTSVRAFETKTKFNEGLICSDEDFNTVLKMFPILLGHLEAVLKDVPKRGPDMNSSERRIFNKLEKGKTYKTAELHEIGAGFDIASRTVGEVIKSLTAKELLENTAHGVYKVK